MSEISPDDQRNARIDRAREIMVPRQGQPFALNRHPVGSQLFLGLVAEVANPAEFGREHSIQGRLYNTRQVEVWIESSPTIPEIEKRMVNLGMLGQSMTPAGM